MITAEPSVDGVGRHSSMRNRLTNGVPSSAEGCGQQGRKQARHRLKFFFQAFWVAAGVCILAVALQSVQQLSSRFKWNSASLGLVLNHPLGFCSKDRPPYICAHGGDSTVYPPNTAAAYAAALRAGADCMEVDVSLTSDLVLVALHDRDLQQLLGQPTAKVQDMTWEELQGLIWPSGQPVMTVQSAVEQVQHEVDMLILDIKTSADVSRVLRHQHYHAGVAGPLTEAGAFLEALQLLPLHKSNNTVVWGKSNELMELVAKSGLPVMTGYTVMQSPGTAYEDPLRFESAKVAAVYHGMLDQQLMQVLRAQQKFVVAWTVDEPGAMAHMLDLAVDGVVTNAPALLKTKIEAALLQCTREL